MYVRAYLNLNSFRFIMETVPSSTLYIETEPMGYVGNDMASPFGKGLHNLTCSPLTPTL